MSLNKEALPGPRLQILYASCNRCGIFSRRARDKRNMVQIGREKKILNLFPKLKLCLFPIQVTREFTLKASRKVFVTHGYCCERAYFYDIFLNLTGPFCHINITKKYWGLKPYQVPVLVPILHQVVS